MKVKKILGTVFFVGIAAAAFAQSDSVYARLESGDPKTEFTNTLNYDKAEKLMDSKDDYAIVGRNLRNADGSEMGPFVLEGQDPKGVRNFSGNREMPEPGFDNLAYAKAMASGKVSNQKTKNNTNNKQDKNTKAESNKTPEKKSDKKSEKM